MITERTSGHIDVLDVLDCILDSGIVIDVWVRVSVAGIDLISAEAPVVLASIDTYLSYGEGLGPGEAGVLPATTTCRADRPSSPRRAPGRRAGPEEDILFRPS